MCLLSPFQLMEGVAGMNNVRNDWHQADIIAALCKRGTTLAAVSREARVSSPTDKYSQSALA